LIHTAHTHNISKNVDSDFAGILPKKIDQMIQMDLEAMKFGFEDSFNGLEVKPASQWFQCLASSKLFC